MSGQYPGGGYNSPLGHRGQFNPQQQQQMGNPMNQMAGGGGGSGGMGMGPNVMGGVGVQGGGMVPMGGMMSQQQSNQMQQGGGGMSGMGPVGPGGMGPGGVGVMQSVGMQSPSHVQQQQMMQQQQMQMQQQQQHQQQQQMGMGVGAGLGSGVMSANASGAGLMQQQQQHQLPQQQMSANSMQPLPQALGGGNINTQQQQTSSQQPSQQATNNMLTISQPNPHKEINIVALSRLGQETVQDITSRFQEIFAALKIIQPTANRDNNTEKKVQEYFRTIRLLFKRVRIIYEKCNDGYPQGMEYTHVESLIPYKEEPDHRIEPAQCEEYRKALQENQELIETVKLKNRQLREIIDRTRIIIWEINTMLSMRRS